MPKQNYSGKRKKILLLKKDIKLTKNNRKMLSLNLILFNRGDNTIGDVFFCICLDNELTVFISRISAGVVPNPTIHVKVLIPTTFFLNCRFSLKVPKLFSCGLIFYLLALPKFN